MLGGCSYNLLCVSGSAINFDVTKHDGIVKSRHSRENGNPENSNYLKRLDCCWSLSR